MLALVSWLDQYTWGMPNMFWVYSAIALLFGIFILLIAHKLKEGTTRRDLVRDLGIACLVALLVSLIYEKSTRSLAEHENAVDTLNKAMSSFVPRDVWTELTKQVMSKNFLRRNVNIRVKLLRDGTISENQTIALPPNKAVLWMSYAYDLYGLSPGSSKVTVQHELDYQMLDKQLRLPRFERVTISSQGKELRRYEGRSLDRIDNKEGSIVLDKEDEVSLPPPDQNIPIRLTTERYEIVNTPGAYNLVMTELLARSVDTSAQTIVISIESLPDDIEPDVTTYYPAHHFARPDPNQNIWTYDSIILPGQGVSIVFKSRANGTTTQSS